MELKFEVQKEEMKVLEEVVEQMRREFTVRTCAGARAVPQYRWQYRTKVVYALRLSVMFPI
jgi:hypothetical protein